MVFLFANQMNTFWEKGISEIKTDFPDHEFIVPKTLEERDLFLAKADGIVYGNLPVESLLKADNLKILFVPWAGLDRLPLDQLQDKKCMIANTHGNSKAVAERAFSLCLSLLGKITLYDSDLRKGFWHGFSVNSPEDDKWCSLREKRVGIIGYGTIGQELASFFKPFHCEVIGFKKHKPSQQNINGIYFASSLDEIIEISEILFLLLPLTKETRNMINHQVLHKMTGKYLVNMGRGDLIEEKSLYESLLNKELSGLAMDVWYQYPNKENRNILPSQYPFHELSNVVLSPHVGGFCHEGQHEMVTETLQNIRSFIKTGKPIYMADPKEGY
jgi:phosphoglycerate dehydrogenase-like enzyme